MLRKRLGLLVFFFTMLVVFGVVIALRAQVIVVVPTPVANPEVPGPSASLLASHNYPNLASSSNSFQVYNCVNNYYVNITTGSDSNNGSSGSPWQHLSAANTASRTGGDCINVAAGTYDLAGSPFNISHTGSSASANGYVAYVCQTLDQCIITSTTATTSIIQVAWQVVNPGASNGDYVVIDGFDINGASNTDGFSSCIDISTPSADYSTSGDTAAHHIWILNNIIHGCGQSGIQTAETEFLYVIHNLIYNNSIKSPQCCQGSGVSFYEENPIPSYTNTTADNALEPYHNIINWNHLYNNRIDNDAEPAYGGPVTDGNNISIDNNSNDQHNLVAYTKKTLVAFNVSYNSGGYGICACANSGGVTIANNSLYNNLLDTNNTATPTDLIVNNSTTNAVTVLNNLSVPASGGVTYSSVGSTNPTWTTNIASDSPSGGGWSCTGNKCNTSASWVAVGTTTTGSKSTPPSPTNFALSNSSAAIGYGTTENYLSSQSVDAGACYHTLTTCP